MARLLASASDDGTTRLWSASDLASLGTLESGRKPMLSLATDGTYLYIGSTGDRSVTVYSLASWDQVATLMPVPSSRQPAQQHWNCWGMVAVQGEHVHVASVTGDIKTYSKRDWQVERSVEHEDDVQRIEIHGTKLYTLSLCDFRQLDAGTGHVQREFKLWFDTYTFAVDPASDCLYTGAEIYYIPENRKVALLHEMEIHAVAVDDKYIYTGLEAGGKGGTRRLSIRYKNEPGWPVSTELPNGYTESLAIAKDRVYSGEWQDGRIHAWSKGDWSLVAGVKGHEKVVRSLALLDNASTVIPALACPSLVAATVPPRGKRPENLLRHSSATRSGSR